MEYLDLCNLSPRMSYPHFKFYFRNYKATHHAFDALRVQEPVVQGVNCLIGINIYTLLKKDWTCIQTIISPEHTEASLLISFHQSPNKNRHMWPNIGEQCNKLPSKEILLNCTLITKRKQEDLYHPTLLGFTDPLVNSCTGLSFKSL